MSKLYGDLLNTSSKIYNNSSKCNFLLKILFLDKNNQTLEESFHQTMLFILFQFLHLYQISYNNFHTIAKVLRIINLIFLIYNRF